MDTKLDLPAGSARAGLLKAMDQQVPGRASYFGFFWTMISWLLD
jgi:hypothetical protein